MLIKIIRSTSTVEIARKKNGNMRETERVNRKMETGERKEMVKRKQAYYTYHCPSLSLYIYILYIYIYIYIYTHTQIGIDVGASQRKRERK